VSSRGFPTQNPPTGTSARWACRASGAPAGAEGAPRGPDRFNIRQTYIKRVAIELIRHYPDAFNGEFANNKEKVLELTDLRVIQDGVARVQYKKLANRIAGYATRYMKRKRGT
jgi:ribosomal protein S17E